MFGANGGFARLSSLAKSAVAGEVSDAGCLELLETLHGYSRRMFKSCQGVELMLGQGYGRAHAQREEVRACFAAARVNGFKEQVDGRKRRQDRGKKRLATLTAAVAAFASGNPVVGGTGGAASGEGATAARTSSDINGDSEGRSEEARGGDCSRQAVPPWVEDEAGRADEAWLATTAAGGESGREAGGVRRVSLSYSPPLSGGAAAAVADHRGEQEGGGRRAAKEELDGEEDDDGGVYDPDVGDEYDELGSGSEDEEEEAEDDDEELEEVEV